ncbi:MAG TPA: hypothetical protein DCZ94_02315 [Lentisphaeria bacterium]|nr:MAG: hypothetical protein A2X48_16235 [Lentisphaerae bacterium GWF2_49_21]HBC85768.1 hypothetical protein [Lentisphaeria bacterium]
MHRIKGSLISDVAAILIISVALLSGLIFSGNWPLSHDGLRYLCHLDQFKDAFDSGILYPRWMPNYYGGYGYPIFVFYQPGYFFFSLLFTYVVPDILAASYASNVAMFFLGGTGVYLLVMETSSKNRLFSLFCSVMFLLTPYIYVNMFVRGDLSELFSMFIIPWAVYFLVKLKDRAVKGEPVLHFAMIISLILAALVYTHPFTALFFYPLFCLIIIALSIEMDKKSMIRFIAVAGAALFCAVIFSSPYWITAFQMKEYVDYHPAVSGFCLAEKHVVYFNQLFSRAWGFGGSALGPGDDMSFQLGLPHFIAAVAGFWLNRKSKLCLSAFILYILCILMMTPISTIFWKNMPLVKYVQFPWRLLTVIALLQVICISGLWKFKERYPGNLKFYSLISLIMIFTIAWYSNEFQFKKFDVDLRKAIKYHKKLRLEKFEVYESFNEFLPKTAAAYMPAIPRGDGAMIEASDTDIKIEEYSDSGPHHMRYKITCAKPQVIMLNQLYFPGWKVILDDKVLDDSTLLEKINKDGRMRIEISAGDGHYLEAFYEGPPGWYPRNCVIALVFISMLVLIMLEQKKQLKVFSN